MREYTSPLRRLLAAFAALLTLGTAALAAGRTLTGVVVTRQGELVPNATVTVATPLGNRATVSGQDGAFSLEVPDGPLTVTVSGEHLARTERAIGADDPTSNVRITVVYTVPPVHESVVITDTTLEPTVDRRNDQVYKDTLFSRDDQVFHTLDAGINAGQHEGGGKSLEVRRFGFNLDHGGVNGGLKVLVDDVQQNQGTQGHGQGYLGQLKSLTPELVNEVTIINGPFSAQYGDFSGLGVVHIQLKESLADELLVRLQGGTFGTFRSFVGYSPKLARGEGFIAYEASRTDGPFLNPLDYRRDNVTGNFTWPVDASQSLSLRFNIGRNLFTSSGQIPLDLVEARELDRFGFVDPDSGGRVQTGVASLYYRKELASGDVLKLDGFVSRSLFDLFSNFTFFLDDPVRGDEIQQHDSRLQEGANAQYLRPYELFGNRALLTAGGNFHDNHILVGLYNSQGRDPYATASKAHAHVTNGAAYVQQAVDFFHGHLHVEGGLRFDEFRFRVEDVVEPEFSGTQSAGRWQPKASVAWTPTDRVPTTLYFNYGRGISSQDARGVVRDPSGPKIATTDFYQVGQSINLRRFAVAADLFLIDRSNEQVYIPDDGSIEFAGPSRAYGFEAKGSVAITRYLSLNGGFTRVTNAFYRGTDPIVYVDSAPHFVANASATLAPWHGFSGSLRYRHIGNYRLDGEDASIRASGLDVVDLGVTKRLTGFMDLNLSVDNLTDKHYFETQNFFESRVAPGAPVVSRIHATPGYPVTVTAGVTFHLFRKE